MTTALSARRDASGQAERAAGEQPALPLEGGEVQRRKLTRHSLACHIWHLGVWHCHKWGGGVRRARAAVGGGERVARRKEKTNSRSPKEETVSTAGFTKANRENRENRENRVNRVNRPGFEPRPLAARAGQWTVALLRQQR